MSYKFTPAGFDGLQQNINIANSATIGGLVDLNANIFYFVGNALF